jgi:hypothetical protein
MEPLGKDPNPKSLFLISGTVIAAVILVARLAGAFG